ncbi:MAG: hypothetical protein NZ528_09890 [Caldilineales bacterium]|nr:hypothetical protein [Caldilineales bacterium]MDW8316678.1 hypothetical protein [Anaerolineae bacterium]
MKSHFLDRISIAAWSVTMLLALSAVLALPPKGANLIVGNTTVTLPADLASLFPPLLALLSGLGTEAVLRAHPIAEAGGLRFSARYWALPVALTMIAAVLQPQAPSALYQALGLLAFALLLSGVLAALYYSLDAQGVGYRRARAWLNLTCYAVALLLFLLIPRSWGIAARSAVTGGVALLLALELLRGTQLGGQRVGLYAAIVAAVMAEVALVLPLLGRSELSNGLLLLLLFYLLVSFSWQTLLRRLNRLVAVELLVVGAVGLALILLFA